MRSLADALRHPLAVRGDAVKTTDSPIESAALLAVLGDGERVAGPMRLSGRGVSVGVYRTYFVERSGYRVMISPQVRIAVPTIDDRRYRLDFAVVLERGDRRAYIALECDGHDFHTNPDDVQRDKVRDRDLASLGWVTLRFTGAEIAARSGSAEVWSALWRTFEGFASAEITVESPPEAA